MSSLERSVFLFAASSLRRKSILTSAWSDRSRSVQEPRGGAHRGQMSGAYVLYPQLASPSSMSAALRGISCYLKEVRECRGSMAGRDVARMFLTSICPAAGTGGAGTRAARGTGTHPAEPQLQFTAPRAAGGHPTLCPPGCHGCQRLLRPLCQDVSPCPAPRSPILHRAEPFPPNFGPDSCAPSALADTCALMWIRNPSTRLV